MGTRWSRQSADYHGIERADTLHAMRHATMYVQRFDRSRVEGIETWADLFIGPNRDQTTTLEVLAHVNRAEKDVLIFHSMPARRSVIERALKVLAERRNQQ